jgi:hypothetical protein
MIFFICVSSVGAKDASVDFRSYHNFIASAYGQLKNQEDFSENSIVYHWEGPLPNGLKFGFPSGMVLLGHVTHGANILNGIPYESRSSSVQSYLNQRWPLDAKSVAYLKKQNVKFVVYHFMKDAELDEAKRAQFMKNGFPDQDGLKFVYQNITEDVAAAFMAQATDIVVYRVTA